MNNKMKELKDLLKQKATEIRNLKCETKEYQRKHGGSCGGRQWTLQRMKSDYRHHHIAYSEMRGKTRDQIEPNSYDDWCDPFRLDESKIKAIKAQYHEDVCTDAA